MTSGARAAPCLGALLACFLLGAAGPARAGEVLRTRVDQGDVSYAGLDLNGDDFPDSVLVRYLRGEGSLVYFFGREDGRAERRPPKSLTEEERGTIQDLLIEEDLDGDSVRDLITLSSRRIARRGLDAPGTDRLLASSIYIGSAGGAFRPLLGQRVSETHRELVLRNARAAVRARLETEP